MNMNVYCIFDVVSREFGQPFAMKNDEMAKRSFLQYTSKSELKKDLDLYRIGTFDIESGVLTDSVNSLICLGEEID